jgi:hypothetical protein
MLAFNNSAAGTTLTTGRVGVITVKGLGQVKCQGSFTHVAWSCQEVGMSNVLLFKAVI